MARAAQRRFGAVLAGALVCALAAALFTSTVLSQERKSEGRKSEVEAELVRLQREITANRLTARELNAETQQIEKELMQLRAEMIVAARDTQRHEAAVSRLEEELTGLVQKEAARRTDLVARRLELGMTLMALQRLAVRPPQALLVTPNDLNDVVRSGLLLRTAIPRMDGRAATIRAELADLAQLQEDIKARRNELAGAGSQLNAERRRMADLADQKAGLLQETRGALDDTTKRVDQLVRNATDLADLLAKLNERGRAQRALDKARPRPKPTLALAAPRRPPPAPVAVTRISQARGNLIVPASGRIVLRFGERNEFGSTAKGITFVTRPGAQVVAPYDGLVVFADRFRQYGLILIIEHGEGYHSLMAGLARVDATVGQWVLGGEPVGVTTGAPDQIKPETNSKLYVEFRRQGQPINPLPWLAVSKKKVRG